jgi:hypothetical protein
VARGGFEAVSPEAERPQWAELTHGAMEARSVSELSWAKPCSTCISSVRLTIRASSDEIAGDVRRQEHRPGVSELVCTQGVCCGKMIHLDRMIRSDPAQLLIW